MHVTHSQIIRSGSADSIRKFEEASTMYRLKSLKERTFPPRRVPRRPTKSLTCAQRARKKKQIKNLHALRSQHSCAEHDARILELNEGEKVHALVLGLAPGRRIIYIERDGPVRRDTCSRRQRIYVDVSCRALEKRRIGWPRAQTRRRQRGDK